MSICAISCYIVLLSDTSFINSFKSIIDSLNKLQLDMSNLTNKFNEKNNLTDKSKEQSSSDIITENKNLSNKKLRVDESNKVIDDKSVLKNAANAVNNNTNKNGGTTTTNNTNITKNTTNNTTNNTNETDNFPLNNKTEFENAFSTLAIWNTLLLHSLNYMGIFFNKSIVIP